MKQQRYRTPVVEITRDEAIRLAEARLEMVELLYGRPSEEMLEASRNCEANSPWQVCEWVIHYRELQELKADAGRETGSPTSATA